MSAVLQECEPVTREERLVQWEEGWLLCGLDLARDNRLKLIRGLDDIEAGMAEWARQTGVLAAKKHLCALRTMGWAPVGYIARRIEAEGIR